MTFFQCFRDVSKRFKAFKSGYSRSLRKLRGAKEDYSVRRISKPINSISGGIKEGPVDSMAVSGSHQLRFKAFQECFTGSEGFEDLSR